LVSGWHPVRLAPVAFVSGPAAAAQADRPTRRNCRFNSGSLIADQSWPTFIALPGVYPSALSAAPAIGAAPRLLALG